jgi:hypothetical protein
VQDDYFILFFIMRPLFILTISFAVVCGLSACKKAEDKSNEDQPIIDIAPQRAQLQTAKELEKKMQQDALNQRKAIELQTNSK